MNKNILLILCLIFSISATACELNDAPQTKSIISDTTTIPLGGNTFIEPKGVASDAISENGITTWSSEKSTFNIYFKNEKTRTCALYIALLPGEFSSKIKCTLGEKSQVVQLAKFQKNPVFVGNFVLTAGYQKLVLEGISKETNNFAAISSLIILTHEPGEFSFVKDNIDNRFYWGRRGPSVHLSYTVPMEKNVKWFYNEVTIPVGLDPIGSYFMANGFAEGYFGIQVNSENERRVLFSVWSPFKTDNPASIPEDQKIKLLKKGEGVYTGEFGNEGSGGQSYLRYKWEAGKTYQFLNSVEADCSGTTNYTA